MVDVFHTLTFKGMNLFPNVSPNYPTQFWLIARFLEALALLCAPLVIGKKPNFYYISTGFASIATAASIAVMYQWMPATFIDGVGLTPFKIISEYVIIAMLLAGITLLHRNKKQFEPRIFFLLSGSLWLAVATEFCFTQYANFYDFNNELGHYFRFLSVAFAFIAIVISGVRQPFELIFREMTEHKHQLSQLNEILTLRDDQLSRAQRIAKIGSWQLDIPGKAHTWSEETYRIFGEPPGKVINFEIFAGHIPPEDKEWVSTSWHSALQGEPYDIEHRILVNGQIRWVREVAEITFAEDGSPLTGLGTVQDITARKQTEIALHESEERYRTAFLTSPDAITITRFEDGCYVDINESFSHTFGWHRDEILGVSANDIGIWHSSNGRQQLLDALNRDGYCKNLEADLRTKNGKVITAIISSSSIIINNAQCLLTVTRDITERKKIERELKHSLDLLVARDHALAHISQGVLITSSDRLITYVNKGFENLTGYTAGELIGKNCKFLQCNNTDPEVILNMRAALDAGQGFRGVLLNCRKDGTEFWNDLSITPIFDKRNRLSQFVGVQHDITEQKLNQETIHKLAFFDSLTQLANRSLLNDRLAQAMAASKRSGNYGALLFLDLDNFKPLNDQFGHDAGDQLLVEVAARLTHCVREADTVARFGGDEFVVVLADINPDRDISHELAHTIAEKILLALAKPYGLSVNSKEGDDTRLIEHRCSASIGMAQFFKDLPTQDELLRRADYAMYQAKQNGRNQIWTFEENIY
jgi:diguanylate cyclase (GGDEF)-like protein/PAS domain S-box-containing protein